MVKKDSIIQEIINNEALHNSVTLKVLESMNKEYVDVKLKLNLDNLNHRIAKLEDRLISLINHIKIFEEPTAEFYKNEYED